MSSSLSDKSVIDPIVSISHFAVLILMIFRSLSLTSALALANCSYTATSADLCQMPLHFQSWEGAEVKWHGSIVDTFHHGQIFVAEHCARSILIDTDAKDLKTITLSKTLRDNWTNKGLITATVTGKLYKDGNVVRLKLSSLDSLVVRPMSETELDHWYAKNSAAILR